VIPPYQRRGAARSATSAAIARAKSEHRRRFMHAYPGVENAPSNALCQRLGFTLLGAYEFEYPQGHAMRCNDWRLDLFVG
jgi:RimJ/RimL family protein N-acetyltransferase